MSLLGDANCIGTFNRSFNRKGGFAGGGVAYRVAVTFINRAILIAIE